MNIPNDSTVDRLRDVFTAIGGGRVSKVTVQGEEMKMGSEQLCSSGTNARITFVDEAAVTLSLNAIYKGAKATWSARPRLLKNDYMSKHLLFEKASREADDRSEFDKKREKNQASKLSEPDQDGFVTVKRGPKGYKGSPLDQRRPPEGKALKSFYRFQKRDESKKRMKKTLEDFKGDQQKIQELKESRQRTTSTTE